MHSQVSVNGLVEHVYRLDSEAKFCAKIPQNLIKLRIDLGFTEKDLLKNALDL